MEVITVLGVPKKRGRKASDKWTFRTVNDAKHEVTVSVTLSPSLSKTRLQELVMAGLRSQAAAAFKRDFTALEPEAVKNREFLAMAKALTSDKAKIDVFMLGKPTELPTAWAYDGSESVEDIETTETDTETDETEVSNEV